MTDARDVDLTRLKRLGQGRMAEVFEWSATSVLKLAREPGDAAAIEHEARVQEAAHGAGAPVPAVLERGTYGGRPGFMMERLEGQDLLSIVASKPWQIWRIGREIGRAHAALHAAPVPPGLPLFHDAARRRLASPAVPDDVCAFALKMLEGLPSGDRVVHGDFHPGNLIRTAHGVIAIDFANATVGDRLADYAISKTILELGEPPPGTSWLEGVLTLLGRKLLLRSYTRSYRPAGASSDTFDRWQHVFLAMRLADEIPEERERILRRLREGMAAER